ncbi:MAG: TonB family protein [Bacteroidales bacterium]|nr:TonB family protein [Bacteroidales bacterium]
MILTRSKNLGIVGTVFIHALLIIYLMLFGFEKKEPITVEEGLPVNFGNIDEANGLFEPAGETTNKPEIAPIPEPEPIDKTDKKMITQDQENSVSLSEKKEAEQTRIKEKQIRTEQEQKAAAIRGQAASAFGTKTGKGTSQGTALRGTGDQGAPTGGSGFGQFSLNGRSVKGGLPRPSYSIQEEGIVVVQIIVNPKGLVTTASVALKGTNTDNATLRSAALSAAKQARFNVIEGNQVQSGTITYRFRLK